MHGNDPLALIQLGRMYRKHELRPNSDTQPIRQSPANTLTHPCTLHLGHGHGEDLPRRSTSLYKSDINHGAREGPQSQPVSLRGKLTRAESTSKTLSEKNACPRVQTLAVSGSQDKWRLATRMKQTMGVSGSIIIILGTVGLLGVFAFLTFLWFGQGSKPEAANSPWVWRQIVLRGYMEQVITIAALVLTIIVSLQATVCTSMIAALILEKRSVPKAKVGFLSVLRAVNDGPQKLIESLLCFRTLRIFFYMEFWLILLLAIVDLSLRFSSTILLSDMHDFTIIGDAGNVSVLSLVSPHATSEDLNSGLMYYTAGTGQAVFPVFGEAKPTNDSLDPSPRGLSDTGLVQRALLPLSESSNRTAVRLYTGNSMVLDSRTVCMPPSLNASITMISLDGYNAALGYLEGILAYGSTLRQVTNGVSDLCDDEGCQEVSFGCTLPAGMTSDTTPSGSSSCLVGGVGGSIFLADGYTQNTQSWDPSEPAWSQNNSIFLVVTTNMGLDSWAEFENNNGHLGDGVEYGEWQSFELVPGRSVNISMCFVAYSMDRYSVHMNTSGGALEPSTPWSILPPHFDTTTTRRYLGLSPEQNTEDSVGRGILELNILGGSEKRNLESSMSSADNVTNVTALNTKRFMNQIMYDLIGDINDFNRSFGTCWSCSYVGYAISSEHTLVLEDVLSTTGRAASMLQSYVAMMAFWAYTSVLSSMGTAETVQLALTSVARAPGPCWGSTSGAGCPGYTAVTVLLGMHMLIVAIITVRFARQIQFSRCAHIWHAIAQVAVSGWLKDRWDRGTDLSDAEYERLVLGTEKGKKDDERWVRLERNVDEGRVEFVKCRGAARTYQVAGKRYHLPPTSHTPLLRDEHGLDTRENA